MDFTTFLPRPLHKPLAYFGKTDWLGYSHLNPNEAKDAKGNYQIYVSVDLPQWDSKNISYEDYMTGADVIRGIIKDRIHLSWLYILSKSLAYGPKVFYPNLEQCESMAQIDTELGVENFQQPYPTVIYRFPKEFSAAIQERFKLPWRATSGVVHIDVSGFILVGLMLDNDERIVNVIPPNCNRLEDYLNRKMGENPNVGPIEDVEMEGCHLLERVLLNSAMLLMQYPIKQWNKNRCKKPDARQRLFALADFEKLSFQQNIVIRETKVSGTVAGSTGRSVIAHWRRGHWKMQPHGPQHSLRKRILIRPVL